MCIAIRKIHVEMRMWPIIAYATNINYGFSGYCFVIKLFIHLDQCSCLDAVRSNALNYICYGPSVTPCTFENGSYRVCYYNNMYLLYVCS